MQDREKAASIDTTSGLLEGVIKSPDSEPSDDEKPKWWRRSSLRPPDATEAQKRSLMIDKLIQADALSQQKEFRIVMTSAFDFYYDARMLVLCLFVTMNTDDSPRTSPASVERIQENLLREFDRLLSRRNLGELGRDVQALGVKISKEIQSDHILTRGLAHSISLLYSEPAFRADWIEDNRFQAYKDLVIDAVLRNAEEDYRPTKQDQYIFSTSGSLSGLWDRGLFTINNLPIRVLDNSACKYSSRRMKRNIMENPHCILHLEDLSAYDERLPEDGSRTILSEGLTYFETIVNSSWFVSTLFVVLILGNATKFKAKLTGSPLSKIYKDFVGSDDDYEKAIEYISKLFSDVNLSKKEIYIYVGDFTDPALLDNIVTALKDNTEEVGLAGSEETRHKLQDCVI
ncbi:hypothetical protein B7463_g8159, partial [Scytalidium lignicola]